MTIRKKRSLFAAFSDPRDGGDIQDVFAEFSSHLSDTDALAALAHATARKAGTSIEEVLKKVSATADDFYVAAPRSVPRPEGGRPAKDWEAEYGKPAPRLELAAVVRHAAHPRPSKAKARRAALIAARAEAGLGKRPDQSIVEDAERLRQAVR